MRATLSAPTFPESVSPSTDIDLSETPNIDLELALNTARQRAKRSGTRLTPIRQHVYEALLTSQQPLGAYDILETIAGVGAQKPPTVYRALDWLMEVGLAQRIATLSKFVASPIPAGPDRTADRAGAEAPVAFLLCRECGAAKAIDAGPITASLAATANDHNFNKEDAVIEISGLCERHTDCNAHP